MQFKTLAEYFQRIESISARLTITKVLAELFNKLSFEELKATIYLLQGRVAPLYALAEFGLAEKSIIKAIATAVNLDQTTATRRYKAIGDIGIFAETVKSESPSLEETDLTIIQVYEVLKRITQQSGSGSQEAKQGLITQLVRQLDPLSVRYLVRIPLATLRLGFSDMTILDALSWWLVGDKTLRPQLEKFYHVRPDLGELAIILSQKGIIALQQSTPKVGTPVIMMRASRASCGQEIIDQLGECLVEPKYDGLRLQIHYNRQLDLLVIYTRGLESVAYAYPDLSEAVKQLPAETMIIEGEAVAFDPDSGQLRPFQETIQRKRKHQIEETAMKTPLKLFAFDLLYLDGYSYIDEPLSVRRQSLSKLIKDNKLIALPNSQVLQDPKAIELIFDQEVSAGLEGIMAKRLTATYQPGARNFNWIKYKRSYSAKINDTIDCVVLGYDYGKGKRANFGIGAILVGVYDRAHDLFVSVAKIGTGLTDREWQQIHAACQPLISPQPPQEYNVRKELAPDVWVIPKIVLEIRADEVTKSPLHTAGYALRFPRLERLREKQPQDATSLEELVKMI